MRAYDRSPDTLKIWELHFAGHSVREIEAELGFKFGKINSALRRGRESGVIPPRRNERPLRMQVDGTQSYMRLGSISFIVNSLNLDQMHWLAAEIRTCGCETVSEFILELVRDAHANEEAKNG